MEIVKITKRNLGKYYNRVDGNIWYRERADEQFQIVDGFSEEECLDALIYGIDMIFVSVNWGKGLI